MPRQGRCRGMKKRPVIDPRRRQPLLVRILSHRFQLRSVVLDVVRPIFFAHQLALLGHRRGHPRLNNDLRVGAFETLEGDVTGFAKRI